MQILFTKNEKAFLSKAILKTTKEPVSHVAIKSGPFVIHSNWKGVNITSYSKFLNDNKIVYSVSMANSERMLTLAMHQEGHMYDFPALLYLGAKLLLSKIGIKLPKKNLWKSSGMYICTELVSYTLYGDQDSMITPFGLYKKLSKISDIQKS